MIIHKVIQIHGANSFILPDNQEFVSFQLETYFDSYETGQKQYVYHILVREVVEVPSEESPSEALEGGLSTDGA